MRLEIAYFNYERGGRPDRGYCGDGGPCDFTGLAQVAGESWPDILVMGEADRYEMFGGRDAWAATAAMRDAGGPAYIPLFCILRWDDSAMFAPVIFVNASTVQIRRHYYHRLPDHSARFDNLLRFSAPGDGRELWLVTGHGDIHSGDGRYLQARTYDRFAKPEAPTMLLMDFNAVPSGPGWEPPPGEYDDPKLYPPWLRARRVAFEPNGPAGPSREDTRSLDVLCGRWDPDRGTRVGGMGWYDVAELHQDFTPTTNQAVPGRFPRAIDRILVNGAMRDLLVPGSYHVHRRPDHSDHNRVSVQIEVRP